MKRKLLAVLGLTAALTIGGAATAYAGWNQASNGAWEYYDSSGNRETDVWRKGADNLWRYVDGSGYMATNQWVDDTYYVDNDGVMAAGKWMQLESASYDHSGTVWYYFGTDGKKETETWKKINNKWYYFDEDGVMLTGWILDDMYYTNSDGVMLTGWQKLYPPDGNDYDDDDHRNEPIDTVTGDGTYWYYFGSNGKKVVPEDSNGADYQEKKINGAYYCFDYNGQMQTGWRNVGGDSTIDNYKYYDENGRAVTSTWLSLEAPEDFESYGDVQWYYFNSRGVPEMGPSEGLATSKDLVHIKGLTFLFNEKGNPIYGLHKVYVDDDSDEYSAYYFGSDKMHCAMLTGKQKVEEADGSINQYYFLSNGKGFTGVKDNSLYYMGKLQKADSGEKYLPITIEVNGEAKSYLVNSSGKVAKNKTVRDSNDVKYKTGSNGVILEINDEDVSGETFSAPQEPVWWDSWENY